MTIISKKALRLGKGNGKDEMIIRPNVQTICPEWVNDDPMFQLAIKAGDIMFINIPGGKTDGGCPLPPVTALQPQVSELETDDEPKGKKKS